MHFVIQIFLTYYGTLLQSRVDNVFATELHGLTVYSCW